jgi:hypothetical protein
MPLIVDTERHRDRAALMVLPWPCLFAIEPIGFEHAAEVIEHSF